MPIDLSDNTEMKSDLLDYSEDLLRQLDMSLAEKKEKEPKPAGKKGKRASASKKNKADKEEVRSDVNDCVYLQIRLTGSEMAKARLVSMYRKCTLTDLFTDSISRRICSLFDEDKENIEHMINVILKK